MTWTWDAYLRLLRETAATIGQLAQVEREKTAAVGQGDLAAVDACMKKEQVFSLNLRGFDQKREKLLAKMGIAGATLRQLEDLAPEEVRLETRETAQRLRQRYEVFRSASEVAMNALECNLHAIEKMQKDRGVQDAPAAPGEVRQADFRA